MISKKLLSILACPINHRPLQLASKELLKQVNRMIYKKKCYAVSQKFLERPVHCALYEPVSSVLYRVENGIPILLPEDAVKIQRLNHGSSDQDS